MQFLLNKTYPNKPWNQKTIILILMVVKITFKSSEVHLIIEKTFISAVSCKNLLCQIFFQFISLMRETFVWNIVMMK